MNKKVGVIVFPGSNSDQDALYSFKKFVDADVVELWHKDTIKNADEYKLIVIPGGFSYGDYLRSGAIAAHSPIMKSVIEYANNGGLVLGICNGFQILCESGLLPGCLKKNTNGRFLSKPIYLKAKHNDSYITKYLDTDKSYKAPIAHSEGCFYAPPKDLEKLKENNQILLHYSNKEGEINEESNPNGSIENIAGISNLKGNVIGLMPHPERCCDPAMGNSDGVHFLKGFLG